VASKSFLFKRFNMFLSVKVYSGLDGVFVC